MSDLFGHTPAPSPTEEERKREKRRAAEVARGYAHTPGTGPDGETCKTCSHCHHTAYATKTYYKCDLVRPTRSRRTDILVRSPACNKWETT